MYPSSRRRLRRVGALAVTTLITTPFLCISATTATEESTESIVTDTFDNEASEYAQNEENLFGPLLLMSEDTEVISGKTEDGASAEIPYAVNPGDTVTLRGSNWTSTDKSAGSTLVVKLYYQLADGQTGTYQRTGTDVVDHPKNGNPEPTIWKLFKADSEGNFAIDLDLPKELEPGQKLSVTITSGLANSADAQRSLVLDPLKIGGVEWVEPDKGDTITCTPSTPKAVVKVAQTAVPGGTLRISGTGFCHPTDGGSLLSIKIDDGLYKHVPGHTVHDNDTIWAIVPADDRTGDFSIDLHLPDGTDSGPYGSDPVFTTGAHSIRVLTGTLKEGDRTRSIPRRGSNDTEFVVGEYRPSGVPDPLHYTETLTDTVRNGVSATESNQQVTVTIPGAKPGDWLFASAYIEDSSRRLPWADNWYTVNDQGQISLPLKDADIPEGRLKLVLQSGNQGHTGELVGWSWITLKESTGNGPGDTPQPGGPEIPSRTGMDLIFAVLPIATAIDGFSGKLNELSKGIDSFRRESGIDTRESRANETENTVRDSGNTNQYPNDEEPSVVTVIQRRSTGGGGGGTPASGNRGTASPRGNNQIEYPPQPENTPQPPVLNISNLTPRRKGTVEAMSDDDGVLTLTVPDLSAGDWVYLFSYGPKPERIGWAQLDENKQMLLDVSGLGPGEHKIALVDAKENLVGWVDVPKTSLSSSSGSADSTGSAFPAERPQPVVATAPLMTGADWAFILGAFAIAQLAMLGALAYTRRRN
ncbi:hypothetical protein [Corynebacterium sp. CCM 9204]|uniref:hypothetical protein n=1 Tax=Corynebacterium sp. CCM 9204 TaxID=3057616 RepID=UPI0035258DF0